MDVQSRVSSYEPNTAVFAAHRHDQREALVNQALLAHLLHFLYHLRNELRKHDLQKGVDAHHNARDARTLSAHDHTRGTTAPLSKSERDRLNHTEAIQEAQPSHKSDHKKLHHHPIFTAYAVRVHPDSVGEITVSIPSDVARKLGLLGPKEKDRAVTASMPMSVAKHLGLGGGDKTKQGVGIAVGPDEAQVLDQAIAIANQQQ